MISYPSDLLPQIEVLGESFEIPVLGKHRRIAVMLPHDYHEQPERRYPVLYLQDGQNLYEDSAPFGTWAVHKRLALLAAHGFGDVIVVAIDHAEAYRIQEFSPFQHPELGKGEGDQYVQFISEELKPQIDSHYRTLPEREHTGIGGSSMGGLISLHAGLQRADLYSKLMIFSPSLWISTKVYEAAEAFCPEAPTRVYLYAGARESRDLLPSVRRLHASFCKGAEQSDSLLTVELAIHPEGNHSEYFWGEAFPHALHWLFFAEKDAGEDAGEDAEKD
jgi:predicted alpha/beta superfamily hydrolase